MIENITIKSTSREEFIDITSEVQRVVSSSGVEEGSCFLYVPHTTAAITINEGADPAVKRDMLVYLNKLVPRTGDYTHMEGNSDAHIKASLLGNSETIIIEKGALDLGTWQSVYFCEFDGPRQRSLKCKIVADGPSPVE